MSEQQCVSCIYRKGESEFYATCTALADRESKSIPFWALSIKKLLRSDMTTRTLAKEGRDCTAYISIVTLAS